MTDSGRNQYHHSLLSSTKDLEAKMHNHKNHVAMTAYKNGLASDPMLGHSAVHHMLPAHRADIPSHLSDSKLFSQPMQYPAQALLPYAAYDFSAPPSPYQLSGSPDIRSSPLYPYSIPTTLDRRSVDYGGLTGGKSYNYPIPLDENQSTKYKFPPTYTNASSSNVSAIHSKSQFSNMQRALTNGGQFEKLKNEKEINSAKMLMKSYATLDSNNVYSESHASSKYNPSSIPDIPRSNMPYANVSSDILASQKYEPASYNQAYKSAMYSNGTFRGHTNSKSPVNTDILSQQHPRNGSPYLPYSHIGADRYPNFSSPYASQYSDKSMYPNPLQNYTGHAPNYYSKESVYSSPKPTPKPSFPPDALLKQNSHNFPDFKSPMFSGTATPPYLHGVGHTPSSMPSSSSAIRKNSNTGNKIEESPKKNNSKTFQRNNKVQPTKTDCPGKLPTVRTSLPVPDMMRNTKVRPVINQMIPESFDMLFKEKLPETPYLLEVDLPKEISKDPVKARTSVIQKHVPNTTVVTVVECTTTVCTSVTTMVDNGSNKSNTVVMSSAVPVVTEIVQSSSSSISSRVLGVLTEPTTSTSVAATSPVTSTSKRKSSLRDCEEFLYDWVSSSEGEQENDDPGDEDYFCPAGISSRRPRSESTTKRPVRKSSRRSLEVNRLQDNMSNDYINTSNESDQNNAVFSPFSICDIDKEEAERAVKACLFSDEITEHLIDQEKQELDNKPSPEPVKLPPEPIKYHPEPVKLPPVVTQKKRGRPGRPKKVYAEGEVRVKRKYVRKKPFVPRNKVTAVKRDSSEPRSDLKVKKRKYNKDVEDDLSDGLSPEMMMSPPMKKPDMQNEESLLNSQEKILSDDVPVSNDITKNTELKPTDAPINENVVPLEPDAKHQRIILPTLQNRTNKNIKITKFLNQSSVNKHWKKHIKHDSNKLKEINAKGPTKVRKTGDGLNRFGQRKKKRGRKPKILLTHGIKAQPVVDITEQVEILPIKPVKEKLSKRSLSFELPPTPDEFSCSDDGLAPETEIVTEEASFAQLNIKKLTCNAAVGETVLHKAAKFGYIDHLMYYLDRGHYDVNVTDNAGYTPLHEASVHNQREAALFLLSRGADVTKCSIDGTLPLHDSVVNDHLEMSRILIACGADPLVSKFSGTNILSMFYSDTMKQFMNAHLKEVKSTSNDPDTKDNKWRMPCSVVYENKSEHSYNSLEHPPEHASNEAVFEFYEQEPIPTYLLQIKPSHERVLYCLLDDVMKYTGNNNIEYEQQLKSEFITYDVFKMQVNESQIMKYSVDLRKIFDQCKLGSIPCPFKLVKYNEIIKKILQVETMSISNNNSPVKSETCEISTTKIGVKSCVKTELCNCNDPKCLKHHINHVPPENQPASTPQIMDDELNKNIVTDLISDKSDLVNGDPEVIKDEKVS